MRQAKLGASNKVKVFIGKGLATHPYRVLRRHWQQRDEAYTENHIGHREVRNSLIKAVLPGGNTISCAYDAEDNLISYTDENGAVTRLEYCGLNELKRRIQPDGQTVEYEYNREEQLIAVINQRGERYELKRGPAGRIIEEVDYWGQSRKYRYSPAGHLLESTDPLGQTIRYKTDPLGRILEKILPDTNQN